MVNGKYKEFPTEVLDIINDICVKAGKLELISEGVISGKPYYSDDVTFLLVKTLIDYYDNIICDMRHKHESAVIEFNNKIAAKDVEISKLAYSNKKLVMSVKRNRISCEKIKEIKKLYTSLQDAKEVANKTNVSITTVRRVLAGKRDHICKKETKSLLDADKS